MPLSSSIVETNDGSHSLHSSTYDATYHSHHGAIQESQHVFMEAGLNYISPQTTSVRIFEMGFGTGLNALLSRIAAEKAQKPMYYESVEAAPVALEQILLLNYPEHLGVGDSYFSELHQTAWNTATQLSPYFNLNKLRGKLEDVDIGKDFNLVYFDAFAPNTQPELWEERTLKKIFDSMAPEGVFVTYCAKGVVKRTLKGIGFEVEGIPGPPGKREMIRARKP